MVELEFEPSVSYFYTHVASLGKAVPHLELFIPVWHGSFTSLLLPSCLPAADSDWCF